MIAIAKPFVHVLHFPHWVFPKFSSAERRRRRATIDLINASPHLLRDIGATEDRFCGRYR